MTTYAKVAPPIRLDVADSQTALPPEGAGKTAILVVHGMGQQVPFETLELVARLVQGQNTRNGGDPSITTRSVEIGAAQLPRAEIRVTRADKSERDVHLYEAYWAPLTEGKVSMWQALEFLAEGAFQGLRHAWPGRVFRRWLFGDWREFPVNHWVTFHFVLAILVVFSVLALNGISVAVVAGLLLGAPWLGPSRLAILTLDLATFAGAVALMGGVILAARRLRRSGADRTQASFTLAPGISSTGWLLILASLVTMVAAAGAAALNLLRPLSSAGDGLPVSHRVGLLLWLAPFCATGVVRFALQEFVGDVAAYVSSHKVSRFNDVREAIQAVGQQVFEAVYSARASGANEFEYERVLVMGHSLGSVVAFDVLNKALTADDLVDRRRRALHRTGLLLTFGSPLEKTAFIFREQKADTSDVRESLAAAKRPMIAAEEYRRFPWVNLWSPHDVISGRLRYYDDPEWTAPPVGAVHNLEDPEACTPLLAHVEYWESELLSRQLFARI